MARVIKNELNRKLRNCMEKMCEATEQVNSENFSKISSCVVFSIMLLLSSVDIHRKLLFRDT